MYKHATPVERTRGETVEPTRHAPPPVERSAPGPTQGRIPGATQEAAQAPEPPAAPDPIQTDVDALVDRELTPGERMYAHAAAPGDADRHLGSVFDPLATTAREAGNTEDQAALDEGRKVAGELLQEFGVRGDEAREIVGALSKHHESFMRDGEIDGDTVERVNASCMADLRQTWGRDTDAMIALAQRTAKQAMAKAPWLKDLIENSSAGSDPTVVKHFAELGLRQARRQRRAGK
ncbi:MAG: hypothetical protein GX856_02655 [Gammaproteobacteria bacterium]|nr:hypothetical protein [Gammaproteobacteria bacterium]